MGNDEMARFRKGFIERNIQGALARELLAGKGIIAAFSTPYARINAAAEMYDRDVFYKKTYADLPARPVLRIHATNLALGQRFTFTQSTFAALSSQLSSYPIGYACAASSAFPILLDPLTLRNHPPVATDLSDEEQMDKLNAREDLNAALRVQTREYYNDKSNQYIHLADGGLVDNQGLQSILDEFDTNGLINKRINYKASPLRRLIIVNVNAGVAPPNTSGRSSAPPGVPSVVQSSMVASMDVLSARRWMDIKKRCGELFAATIDVRSTERSYQELEEPYRIEVSFRNIADLATQQKAMALPTSFKLTTEQLALIDQVVPTLLNEDPDLIRLKAQLAK
jgi:NTE family protein